jgi:hypothetical protein
MKFRGSFGAFKRCKISYIERKRLSIAKGHPKPQTTCLVPCGIGHAHWLFYFYSLLGIHLSYSVTQNSSTMKKSVNLYDKCHELLQYGTKYDNIYYREVSSNFTCKKHFLHERWRFYDFFDKKNVTRIFQYLTT